MSIPLLGPPDDAADMASELPAERRLRSAAVTASAAVDGPLLGLLMGGCKGRRGWVRSAPHVGLGGTADMGFRPNSFFEG